MSEQKFKPFDRVLGRMCAEDNWKIDFYVICDPLSDYPHRCFRFGFAECIPYEGNEHFLGTTDSPKFMWLPKPGELVAVSDDKKKWFAQVFISKVRGRIEGAYEASDTHDSSQPAYWQYCEPLREHFNVLEE